MGKVKPREVLVEACRGSADKRSSNLWLGVKSQSSLVIAGSYQSWPKSSLKRGSKEGKDTDREFRRGNLSVLCQTLNILTL